MQPVYTALALHTAVGCAYYADLCAACIHPSPCVSLWCPLQVLRQVADKHNVSVANVALRWVMQQGDGASVFPIVGFRGASHLEDNARVLALQLDAADMAAIQEVLDAMPGPAGDIYSFERGE